jgi:hypothetical protein
VFVELQELVGDPGQVFILKAVVEYWTVEAHQLFASVPQNITPVPPETSAETFAFSKKFTAFIGYVAAPSATDPCEEDTPHVPLTLFHRVPLDAVPSDPDTVLEKVSVIFLFTEETEADLT